VRAFDLRLELSDVVPAVWRVIRLPAHLHLDDLHYAIQAVMGWDDFHPHVFEVGEREYGPKVEPEADDDAEFVDASAWAGEGSELTIAEAFKASAGGFSYIYDFVDEWRVRVSLAGEADVEDASPVVCLAGEHAGPQQESRDLEPFTLDTANRRLRRALRPRATAAFPAGVNAAPDQQLLANLTLVILLLGSHRTTHGSRQAWKTVRVEILESLHEAGLIESDPRHKSVLITDAGVAHAQRLLQRLRTL
jgi:hypothetical protein